MERDGELTSEFYNQRLKACFDDTLAALTHHID